MRNTPLRAFASPIKQQNESVSDSTSGRHDIRPVEIVKEKKETYNPGKDAPKPGKIYDKGAQDLAAMQQANPLARLFTGIKTKG